MSTNGIFDALIALATNVQWNGQNFAETGRRLKMWDKAPQPSCYQVEPDEAIKSTDGQLDKSTLTAKWIIYFRVGKDQSAVPARMASDIVDAVKAALRPPMAGARQTLGGLVYRTFIDGTITKDSGDLDGQGMIIVPITIIVP